MDYGLVRRGRNIPPKFSTFSSERIWCIVPTTGAPKRDRHFLMNKSYAFSRVSSVSRCHKSICLPNLDLYAISLNKKYTFFWSTSGKLKRLVNADEYTYYNESTIYVSILLVLYDLSYDLHSLTTVIVYSVIAKGDKTTFLLHAVVKNDVCSILWLCIDIEHNNNWVDNEERQRASKQEKRMITHIEQHDNVMLILRQAVRRKFILTRKPTIPCNELLIILHKKYRFQKYVAGQPQIRKSSL